MKLAGAAGSERSLARNPNAGEAGSPMPAFDQSMSPKGVQFASVKLHRAVGFKQVEFESVVDVDERDTAISQRLGLVEGREEGVGHLVPTRPGLQLPGCGKSAVRVKPGGAPRPEKIRTRGAKTAQVARGSWHSVLAVSDGPSPLAAAKDHAGIRLPALLSTIGVNSMETAELTKLTLLPQDLHLAGRGLEGFSCFLSDQTKVSCFGIT